MLLDFIDDSQGKMLSSSWSRHEADFERRQNLFHGLSRIIISLARFPQTRTSCYRFNDDGSITLDNPPLLCANIILKSESVSRTLNDLPCDSDTFPTDLLSFRMAAFRNNPNAIYDEDDCHLQMANMTLLQAVLPRLVDIKDKGLFLLQYTDLHARNIFVDDDWNVTGIIDLKCVCALPSSTLDVLHWLSASTIDGLSSRLEKYARI